MKKALMVIFALVAAVLCNLRAAYWEARVTLAKARYVFAYRVDAVFRQILGLPRARGMHSVWSVRHRDRKGRLIYADYGHNMLHDEGEEWFCQVLFSEAQSVPTNFYIGLDNRTSLAETDVLATEIAANESSGNGYAREAVASDTNDWTVSQVSDDWRAASKTVTFTASGGSIGPETKMFLATTVDNTGKLIASRALSQSRTIADGESLDCSIYLGTGE